MLAPVSERFCQDTEAFSSPKENQWKVWAETSELGTQKFMPSRGSKQAVRRGRLLDRDTETLGGSCKDTTA